MRARPLFTAIVLGAVVRPTLKGRTRREIGTVCAYGFAVAGMNWSFYEALHHLPLGVATTIEFTGPLAVAVAGSRRALDAVWIVLAAGGVVLLATRGSHAGCSFTACCWR